MLAKETYHPIMEVFFFLFFFTETKLAANMQLSDVQPENTYWNE